MRKNYLKFILAFLFFIMIQGFITSKTCYAASAGVEITSDAKSVTVGDDFFVYIKINSNTTFGDFEANLNYNEAVLEYVKGTAAITGNNGFLRISDIGVENGDNNRKYIMKFKALKSGVCKISFADQPMVYEYESGDEMSVSSNILTIDVKPKKTASENANLKSLKISPSKLEPIFNKSVHEYSVTVDNDTQKLIINAIPENEKATVSVSGNDFLKEGENKVIVSVLSESGVVIEYTINVNREKASSEQITPSAVPGDGQGIFNLSNIDGETYAVFSGKYKILDPDSTVKIPDGYVSTSITMSGITIPAYAPENKPNAEILLIYAENKLGEKGFYYFDRVEKTILRYMEDNSIESINKSSSDTESIKPDQNKSQSKVAIIIILLLSGLCTILAIVIIRLFMKVKGFRDEDLH